MKKLAIIILDWNGYEDTIECLADLTNTTLYDIYLLDNGSNQENSRQLKQFLLDSHSKETIKILSCEDCFEIEPANINLIISSNNLGFAIGNNVIANRISNNYDYILLLNNDTEIPQNSIEHMVGTAEKYNTDALTCIINFYFDKNKLWNAGGKFTIYGDRKYYSQERIEKAIIENNDYISADFITGCALLLKGSFVSEYGLFTDAFFHGEEDFNLCYRMKRMKCAVGVDLCVKIFHKVGNSLKRATNTEKSYSSMLVHYLNRVIDFKSFYSKPRWKIWRMIYLSFVLMKRVSKGMNIGKAFKMVKHIITYSNKYNDVRKPLFDEIMCIEWNQL